MKITFMGAAQTVTGSCYIAEADGARFAIDCGMHQGNAEIEKRNRNIEAYRAKELDFILLTHAHIDHSGLLPALVAAGFNGKVYATKPTLELIEILLLDSAHIQEMEAEWANKKRRRHGEEPQPPLYTQADAEAVMPLLSEIRYEEEFEPAKGIKVKFRDAGHILGSAFVELIYQNGGDQTKAVFSGDLGRPDQLIVSDPKVAATPDYLFLESTYGDRNHKDAENSMAELAEAIAYSYKNGEKVVIPAFAVERSQQIIYCLFLLAKQGKLPEDMPVYLDSPLAIRATKIFKANPNFLDANARKYIDAGDHPFDLPNLKLTLKADESIAINERPGPAVIISASGMANAGRIKHHLKHNLWRKGASVIFVGYQAQGTPGRKIVNGARRIKIFGEDVAVAAKIYTIGGFSAHAGQSELMDWLNAFRDGDMQVMLVHGEYSAQQKFAKLITEQTGLSVHIPGYLEELTLEAGREIVPVLDVEKAMPKVDWEFLAQDSERLYIELRKRLKTAGEKPWLEQTEVRDRLLDLNKGVMELISEL